MPGEKAKKVCLEMFGERGKKQFTCAACVVKNAIDLPIVAAQSRWAKSVVISDKYPEGTYHDARSRRVTNRDSETGVHAEMMIVSALLGEFGVKAGEGQNTTLDEWKMKFASTFGKIEIAANAMCCWHCANTLYVLGIEYSGDAAPPGLTGWWNPFTDKAYGNGTADFLWAVPGSQELVKSAAKKEVAESKKKAETKKGE